MDGEIIKIEDKEIFLKSLNKKGFLLEDKTWKILNELSSTSISRNKVVEHEGERVEIDFIFESDECCLIGDCKRTDFSWIFAKANERSNTLNIIYDSSKGMKVRTKNTSTFSTAWTDIGVMFGEDGKLVVENNGFAKSPRESWNDLHKNIRQILKETEAYIQTRRFLNKIIIPIIVTNSKLCLLKYSKGDIGENGDLTNYESIKEVEGIVYNFPEVLKWDKMQQIIKSNDDEHFQHHVKSIFIVNINHLRSFIPKILNQYFKNE